MRDKKIRCMWCNNLSTTGAMIPLETVDGELVNSWCCSKCVNKYAKKVLKSVKDVDEEVL